MPIVVLLAFALTSGRKTPASSTSAGSKAAATTPVTIAAATPSPDVIEPCAQVVSKLPVQLEDQAPRIVHPTPNVAAQAAAWGDPPITFLCGVARPAQLVPGSTTEVSTVDGVNWLTVPQKNQTTYYLIDRPVYIQVVIPESQHALLPPFSQAVLDAGLPQVCQVPGSGGPQVANDQLCTHRP
ncbi:MAG: DUF3515 domain-containing protein [Actinobacteria bacterium]|nr:DUF3515 domain-containing protein [Actinomycetota bacterium]